ncbi:hypothetical protein ACE1TF_06425 [Geomicrobium sp. JSM 1781026]|uniref:hypothetical protein n=1 Tax=unclassified Geomicrobium TaxID=2628951 RepID=UPI0012690D89|nr:hypothetical protein [Geomicrobium sp. JCM 19037]
MKRYLVVITAMVVFFVIELNMSTIHYTSEQEAEEIERILDRAWEDNAITAYQIDGEEERINVYVDANEDADRVKKEIITNLNDRDLGNYRVSVAEEVSLQ